MHHVAVSGCHQPAVAAQWDAMAQQLTLTLPNEVSAVAEAVDATRSFCNDHRVTAAVTDDIALALEELLMNVVEHAYGDDKGRSILLALAWHDDTLTAVVDPTAAPPPDLDAELEDRPIGGLGVHLARSVVDEMRYERAGGINRVTLSKSAGGHRD